ncbi:disease resistance protein RUN1-like [Gastrolobium bilobum]|uniref:disease resistance protein RUN1-like n=1 Tax=Gastrolobium bilobum TaxID=150636 RepID=UPI002AAF81D8|nr:disease resistance protein RUN1-like [Gastrolobium bilobum]
MNHLLSNDNVVLDLSVRDKTDLLRGDELIQDGFEISHNDLANTFIKHRVQGNGPELNRWESVWTRSLETIHREISLIYPNIRDGFKQDFQISVIKSRPSGCGDSPGTGCYKKVLSCCEFHPYIGIGVLVDKSLLTVSSSYANFPAVKMHDLLEELGKKLVRENSPKKPIKWSRLWLYKDLFKVMLKEKMGGNNVEAIVLNSPEETRRLMAEGLSKMNHLRLLILRGVKFSGSLKCLSNKLRYVEWNEYPFMYLPPSFQPEVPVHLILKHSCMTQLWEGKKYMPNLISLDLSHSKNLIKMPDFGEVPNLERLSLEGCIKLVEIDPSIGLLRKLEVLNLEDCKNLLSIPNNIVGLTSIKSLNLSGCSKVFNNQLDISSETAMHSQSASSCIFKRCLCPFRSLNYKDSAISLLPSLPSFSCLVYLKLSFCKLVQFPEAIGSLHYLKYLNLEGNKFVTLTCSLKEFSKLVDLRLSHCKRLKSLPELPSCTDIHENFRIIILYVFNCPNLEERERCSTMIFPWMAQVIEVHTPSFLLTFIYL